MWMKTYHLVNIYRRLNFAPLLNQITAAGVYTWTFKFCKVSDLRRSGKLYTLFLRSSSVTATVKEWLNQSIFTKVILTTKVARLCGSRCSSWLVDMFKWFTHERTQTLTAEVINLITGKVIDAINHVIFLFLRQDTQLFVVNNSSTKLQLTIQLGRLICPAATNVYFAWYNPVLFLFGNSFLF